MAILAMACRLPERLDLRYQDRYLLERPSEAQELFLFYFVLLYLVALRGRIGQARGRGSPNEAPS